MILGTISSYTAGKGVSLTIDGESNPTAKKYAFLSTYTPVVGDRVLIEEISGTYVVLGSISTTASNKLPEAILAEGAYSYSTKEVVQFRARYGTLSFKYGTNNWYELKNA